MRLALRSPISKRYASFELEELDASTGNTSQALVQREAGVRGFKKILPLHFHHCCVEDMVIMATGIIQDAIDYNDKYVAEPFCEGLTLFHSRQVDGARNR